MTEKPNHRRLLEPIGNIPPAEAEARFYAQTEGVARAAWLNQIGLREIPAQFSYR